MKLCIFACKEKKFTKKSWDPRGIKKKRFTVWMLIWKIDRSQIAILGAFNFGD